MSHPSLDHIYEEWIAKASEHLENGRDVLCWAVLLLNHPMSKEDMHA